MLNSRITQDYYAGGLSIVKDGFWYLVVGKATGYIYYSTPIEDKCSAEYFCEYWKNDVKKMVTPSLHNMKSDNALGAGNWSFSIRYP